MWAGQNQQNEANDMFDTWHFSEEWPQCPKFWNADFKKAEQQKAFMDETSSSGCIITLRFQVSGMKRL